jgi:hypothetical protein
VCDASALDVDDVDAVDDVVCALPQPAITTAVGSTAARIDARRRPVGLSPIADIVGGTPA